MQNAPNGALCNTLDLQKAIICLEKHFGLFESGRFRQVLLYMYTIVSINDMGHLRRCSYISHMLKVAILTHCFLTDCPIHIVAICMGLYGVTGRTVFLTLDVV